jgi:hypothetical protein
MGAQPINFDVAGARNAGYSEDEILQHLTATRKFDVNGAVNAGYSKGEIIQHLASTPAPARSVTSSDLLKMSPEDRANYELSRSGIGPAAGPAKPRIKVEPVDTLTGMPQSVWDEATQRGKQEDPDSAAALSTGHTPNLPVLGATLAKKYIQTEAESLDPEATTTPRIASAYKKIVAPEGKAAATFLEGQYQPENLALMGAFSGVPKNSAFGRIVHAGAGTLWGGQAAVGAGEKIASGAEKLKAGDTPGAIEDLTGAGFEAGIAAAVGKDLAKGAGQTKNDAITLIRNGGKAIAETKPGQMVSEAVQGVKAAWNPEKNLTPQQAATKAFRPRNSKTQWKQEINSALPDMRRAADASGVDIENLTLDDALQTASQAKKDVWAEYENNHLNPAAPIRVPVQAVGDAMRATVNSRTAEQNPALASKIKRNAATYDNRTLSVAELQDRLSQLNNQTRAIEAKYVTDKRAAKLDPRNAATFAERDTLRSLLNQTLDSATGEGGQALRKRWGALNSVEDVISRRIPVAERANPVSLTRILELLHGPGRVVRGVFSGSPGDIAMGAFNTKAMMNAEKMNDPEWLTQQAFKKTTPTPAANMREVVSGEYVGPTDYKPTAGLLPEAPPTLDPVLPTATFGPQLPPNEGPAALPGDVRQPLRLPWMPRINGRNQLPPMALYPEASVPESNAVEAVGIPQTAEADALRRNYEQKGVPAFLRRNAKALPAPPAEGAVTEQAPRAPVLPFLRPRAGANAATPTGATQSAEAPAPAARESAAATSKQTLPWLAKRATASTQIESSAKSDTERAPKPGRKKSSAPAFLRHKSKASANRRSSTPAFLRPKKH